MADMPAAAKTLEQVTDELDTHSIAFGGRYRDPHSGFEGVVTALHFYQHGCLRVELRGTNRQTGAPVECSFDAPELEQADSGSPVPEGEKKGGPHGLTPPPRH